MNLCVLASGSKGNVTYINVGNTSILIDAGISARGIQTRLTEIGQNPESIKAIIISHEHGDHINGARVFAGKYNLPIWVNSKTLKYIKEDWSKLKVRKFEFGKAFKIDELEIHPFYVSHDTEATSAFVLKNGSNSVGIATDLGDYNNLVIQYFKDCDAIIIESNYEDELLMHSSYPWEIKTRIRGQRGHLSNKRSFELLQKISGYKRLRYVILAHISKENNSSAHLESYIKKYMPPEIKVIFSAQDKISEYVSL